MSSAMFNFVDDNPPPVTPRTQDAKGFDDGRACRGWLITLNNPTELERDQLIGDPQNPDYQYLIFQFERGAEGTLHIQGYIHFKNPRIMPKKLLPRAHLERSVSTAACIRYCSKEDTRVPNGGPFEFGTCPIKSKEESNQGQRSDLRELALLAMDRETPLDQIAQDHPDQYVRYHKGLTALRFATAPNRSCSSTNYWFHGPSGAGKTRHAMKIARTSGDKAVFIKDASQWWDGYDQQETIIIDDFDKNRFPFRSLLTLLDQYQHQAQVKGGYAKINSSTIIVTCEFSPSELWSGNELAQVERRLNHIIKFVMPANQSHRKPSTKTVFLDESGNLVDQTDYHNGGNTLDTSTRDATSATNYTPPAPLHMPSFSSPRAMSSSNIAPVPPASSMPPMDNGLLEFMKLMDKQ